MDLNDTTHPTLSFDGCGINGRDQYRTRIATFTDKRGPVAQKYGPLFAASEEMRDFIRKCLEPVEPGEDCCLPPELYNEACNIINRL